MKRSYSYIHSAPPFSCYVRRLPTFSYFFFAFYLLLLFFTTFIIIIIIILILMLMMRIKNVRSSNNGLIIC